MTALDPLRTGPTIVGKNYSELVWDNFCSSERDKEGLRHLDCTKSRKHEILIGTPLVLYSDQKSTPSTLAWLICSLVCSKFTAGPFIGLTFRWRLDFLNIRTYPPGIRSIATAVAAPSRIHSSTSIDTKRCTESYGCACMWSPTAVYGSVLTTPPVIKKWVLN